MFLHVKIQATARKVECKIFYPRTLSSRYLAILSANLPVSSLMTTTNKCSPSSGVKNPPQFLQLDCRLCKRRFNQVDMHQLWPCLHMFCRECVDKCRTSSKVTMFFVDSPCISFQVCPASNCYSPLKLNDEHRWNSCDNDLCPRRLSSLNDLYKQVICQHELW